MKCWICGDTATTTKPTMKDGGWIIPPLSENRRCYCEKCLKEYEQKELEEKKLLKKLNKREMFRKACRILERQNTNMYDYKEAIEVVEEFIESNPEKFDSSYEVLTAMVLVKNRIHAKAQYKVGPYKVDFLLPDMLVALEIDGDRHKYKQRDDIIRDHHVKKALGPHWEIVRISTDDLDKDAKKIPYAIDKVLEYRETNHINWRSL